ncbi:MULTISPECIES: helix-turn-helix domain-containing protein [Halorussus]|uniref:winged helix-turn-helix transcriptional regulator n=1 Tax=Halorussus TaxID=1070314 RepID=UPI000E2121D6|nr:MULTISPECIES: helix-turn-helix domain-containing protein [Halorussus]NHN60884.1 helix-turn-helix transcriptional regulator [Halorussus sp. JP-T4]
MSSIHSQPDGVEEKNPGACPVVEAIEQIGSKWRLVVLSDLHESDEKRFNELERSTGASSRTLSRVLDDLEEAGLVNRRVEDKPIATYYSLTDKSRQLCPVFEELESWADEWIDAGPADPGPADD